MVRRKLKWGIGAAIVALLLCVIIFQPVFSVRHWYFCNFTLSFYSYRTWPFGIQTDHIRRESALESFLRDDLHLTVRHDWAHGRTGLTFYGQAVEFGDPRVSPAFSLRGNVIAEWIAKSEPLEVKAFYELLVSEDQEAIAARVGEIEAELSP